MKRSVSAAVALSLILPQVGITGPLTGADPTGVLDSTDAINNCLATAALTNGQCGIQQNGSYKISGDIKIPSNTSLLCGPTVAMRQDYNSGFAKQTALMLDRGHSIRAAGDGAQISGCLTYRQGMTFPPANAEDFGGIAITDDGYSDFSLINSTVAGFDTCVYVRGLRPYVGRSTFDCAGNDKAAIEWDVGNTDSGYIRDVRVNPLNGSGTCVSLQRPGTGIRMGGSGGPGAYMDGVVVQGYQKAQYDLANAGLTEVGQIWADNPIGLCGLVPSPVGLLIGPGASIHAHQVQISAQGYPIWTTSNGAQSYIGVLSLANSYFGILLGHAEGSGNIATGLTVMSNISYPAIYVGHANPGYHSMRTVLSNVNGGSPPYIWSDPGVMTQIGTGPFGQFSVVSFQTDLGDRNPFQMPYFIAGPGSADTLIGISFPRARNADSQGDLKWPDVLE